MRIIAKSRLKKYWESLGNEKTQPFLVEWYHFCEKQKWANPQDVKNTFRHASFVAGNRIVFNVKGNNYRIVCAMDYQRQTMFSKFVGTHVEYDKIAVEVVE